MLIVTGANGTLGRLVVEALLARIPATQLGVSVRDPAAAAALAARGVRVRRGDFAEPATLDAAFEGATQVLLISSSTGGAQAAAHHGGAIEAAKRAGAQRVFYTSHVGASATSPFAPMQTHAATEALLAGAGIPYTVLRNGFYAASLVQLRGRALTPGELPAPADGPVSWTAHADLAEATAWLLVGGGRGQATASTTLALTADAAYDLDGVAALLGIRRTVIADADYRAALLAAGLPPLRADMTVGIFGAARLGDFARVEPTLAQLLGRAPTPLRDVLTAQSAAGFTTNR